MCVCVRAMFSTGCSWGLLEEMGDRQKELGLEGHWWGVFEECGEEERAICSCRFNRKREEMEGWGLIVLLSFHKYRCSPTSDGLS